MCHYKSISHVDLKASVEVGSAGRMAQAVRAGAAYFAGQMQTVKTWLAGKDQVNRTRLLGETTRAARFNGVAGAVLSVILPHRLSTSLALMPKVADW